MDVITDLKRMILQALGKENMFGYKTTLANQLYLIYCLMGNLFYTDKIHLKTKYIWFCSAYFIEYFCASASAILYFMYGRQTADIMIPIYIGFTVGIALLELFLRPAIMLSYKHDIEQMIKLADDTLMKKPTTTHTSGINDRLDAKQVTVTAMAAFLVPFALFYSMYGVNMVFFYDKEKIKDYMYYPIPMCGLENFEYVTYIHVFITILCIWGGMFFFPTCTANRSLAVTWVVVCYNEAQRIINELNSWNVDADSINIDTYKSSESKFNQDMRRCIHDLNHLTRLISSFQNYFETTAGVILPILLYIEVVHAVLFITPGFPFGLRVKEFIMFVGTISEVYTMCWVGAKLEEMTTALSFAVYSTPWYWMKDSRKNVHILLCQTQAPINPVALNVYPLTLSTFLRFCNVINSTVNLARAAYTQRK